MKLEFHHINFVSENIEELDMFYQNIMQMETKWRQNAKKSPSRQGQGISWLLNLFKFLMVGAAGFEPTTPTPPV